MKKVFSELLEIQLLAVCICLILMISVGCTPNSYIPSNQSSSGSLVLLDNKVQSEEYFKYIVGTVKNNSSHDYSYVSIEFSLLDDQNNKIGTAVDYLSGLRANETWKFKCMILEDAAAHYRLESLSGW